MRVVQQQPPMNNTTYNVVDQQGSVYAPVQRVGSGGQIAAYQQQQAASARFPQDGGLANADRRRGGYSEDIREQHRQHNDVLGQPSWIGPPPPQMPHYSATAAASAVGADQHRGQSPLNPQHPPHYPYFQTRGPLDPNKTSDFPAAFAPPSSGGGVTLIPAAEQQHLQHQQHNNLNNLHTSTTAQSSQSFHDARGGTTYAYLPAVTGAPQPSFLGGYVDASGSYVPAAAAHAAHQQEHQLFYSEVVPLFSTSAGEPSLSSASAASGEEQLRSLGEINNQSHHVATRMVPVVADGHHAAMPPLLGAPSGGAGTNAGSGGPPAFGMFGGAMGAQPDTMLAVGGTAGGAASMAGAQTVSITDLSGQQTSLALLWPAGAGPPPSNLSLEQMMSLGSILGDGGIAGTTGVPAMSPSPKIQQMGTTSGAGDHAPGGAFLHKERQVNHSSDHNINQDELRTGGASSGSSSSGAAGASRFGMTGKQGTRAGRAGEHWSGAKHAGTQQHTHQHRRSKRETPLQLQ